MLRAILKVDVKQLLRLDQAVNVVPWDEEAFQMCFQPNYWGWVIELDQKAIAFIVASLQTDECHILNLCVEHAYQRQGFGLQLLQYLLNEMKQKGARIAYLEVRRSNTKAIALYKKMNFHLVGERKHYYPTVSGHEDALVFAQHLKAVGEEI